jgi:hypothetical protein
MKMNIKINIMTITVISGGQTGIDVLALEIAKSRNIKTGGWMPKNWKTEKGAEPELEKMYDLKQTTSVSYPVRTEANVKQADITVILNRSMGRGSTLTKELCDKHSKPCLINPTLVLLHEAVVKVKVKVGFKFRGGLFLGTRNVTINFAGTRGSRLTPEDTVYFEDVIKELLLVDQRS